jgi:1,4-alpha-glucan branching enzyme
LNHINQHEGGLDKFTKGYEYYGVHRLPDNSIVVREWAPGAEGIYIKGDFSEWPFFNFKVILSFNHGVGNILLIHYCCVTLC